jgi:hypothetical protein
MGAAADKYYSKYELFSAITPLSLFSWCYSNVKKWCLDSS